MVRHIEHLAVCKSFCVWPVIMNGLAHNAADLLELVHLGRTGKQRLESVQLGHDATESKNVDRIVVTPTSKYIFWRPVPARAHIFSEGSRVSDFLDKAKIAELNSRLILDEHVLRLHIPVEEAVLVDVVEGDGDLLDDVADLLVRKRVVVEFAHLHLTVKIHVEQLKDDHEHLLVQEHFATTDNIGVL